MKKLSPLAYKALFFKHVWSFIGSVTSASEREGEHAVAVSGGLDSMTLLWFLNTLHQQGKIGRVRAMFVNHHTRLGQKGDEDVVRRFCELEKIPLKVLHVKGLSPYEANFEARARKERRDLCKQELRHRECLWVGHHLDDSYEWNFMQRHRSNNPRASIGIPVRNGPMVRPFLCVTRAQIKKLARFEGITYRDDPTNLDIRFDRNYVRHMIVKPTKKRYPGYLKFYANFANFSAMLLKVSIMTRTGPAKIFAFETGAALIGKHFSDFQIQEVIHTYSNADRGEIIGPIQRMFKAIDNGKKGPFHFSGGLEAYYTPNLLMIYQQGMKNYDEEIAKALNLMSPEQLVQLPSYKRVELKHALKNLLHSPDALLNMPGLVLVLESDSICKTLNTSVFDPLFPEVSKVCQAKNLRFITLSKCIDVWELKKEKLPQSLRLLPLSNLSNLFTSQQSQHSL